MKKLFKLKKLNKWLINIMDIGVILLGFYGAFMIKFDFNPPARNFRPFLLMIPFIVLFSFIYINIYDISQTRKKKVADIGTSIFIALSMLHITTMASTFIFRGFAFPRSIFVIAFVLQFFGLILCKTLLSKLIPKIYGVQQAMIIGDAKQSKKVARKLLADNKGSLSIKYMVHNYNFEKIQEVIHEVDVLVICPKIDNQIKSQLVALSLQENKKVYLIPDVYDIMLIKSKLTNFDDMPGLEIEALGLSLEEKLLKRAFDIIVSIVLIILGMPFMILSGILVKISSQGPVLFKQERLTIYNRPFNLYKFRTMINNAEKDTGPTLAKDKDMRITKIGHFLRMTRLDELPQLFNVLKGDMSIVGPRPERNFFAEKFIKENAEFRYRTNVKAGITGLAQVYGKYSTSSENKLRYDLLYIRNYSFILDIILILKTIKTMVTKASSKGIEEDKAMELLIKDKDKDEMGFFEVVATSEEG